MKRSYLFIGIILLAATVSMGYWVYKVWVKPVNMPVQTIQQNSVGNKVSVNKRGIVSDRNADDLIPMKFATPEAPKLFGTIIMKYKKIAIFEDPITKITRIYYINDSVAGFIILDIQKDKVILLWGEEEIEVYLRDSKDIQFEPLPSVEASRMTTRPARPILPPGTSHLGMPYSESQLTSEETVMPEEYDEEEEADPYPAHPRWNRRPVHESLETPLTPPPPITPTFGDEEKSTEK